MKTLSRLIGTLFLTALLLGVGRTAHAQPGMPDPEQIRSRMVAETEDTISRLELDEATAENVRAVLMASIDERIALFKETREMRANGNGDRNARRAMRDRMMQLQQETGKKLAEILSDEQMARYRKIVAEKRGGRRGGPPGGPRGGQ